MSIENSSYKKNVLNRIRIIFHYFIYNRLVFFFNITTKSAYHLSNKGLENSNENSILQSELVDININTYFL